MRHTLPRLAAVLLLLAFLGGCADGGDNHAAESPGPYAELDALLLAAGPFDAWPGADGWSAPWRDFSYPDGGLFGVAATSLLPPFDDPDAFTALTELAPDFADIIEMIVAGDRTIFFADADGIIALGEQVAERLPGSPLTVSEMAMSPDDGTLYAVSNDVYGDEPGLWAYAREAQEWTHIFDDNVLRHLAVDTAGRVFAANDSFVYVFDTAENIYGIIYENTGTAEQVRDLTCGNDQKIYFTAIDHDLGTGIIYTHTPADGTLSSLNITQKPDRIVVRSLGDILFASAQSGLYEMPAGGDAQLLACTGGPIIDLAIDADDNAYAIGASGFIGRLPVAGTVKELDGGDGLQAPRLLAIIP